MDRDFGNGLQSIKIDLLTCRRRGVNAARNAGRVIFDSEDYVRGIEYCLGELLDIEPFQGRSFFEQPEIKIEAVNVNNGAQNRSRLKSKGRRSLRLYGPWAGSTLPTG